MGVLYQTDPANGSVVGFRIDGDTPTATEKQRISQYLQSRRPAPPPAPEPEPEEVNLPGTALGRSVRRGAATIPEFFGSAAEQVGAASGIGSLERIGRGAREYGEEAGDAIPRAEASMVSPTGIAQLAGESAAPMAGTMAGAGLGAGIGSVLGPPGAAAGGVIGGLLASTPYFTGDILERQRDVAEEEGREFEPNLGSALAGGAAMGALDVILPSALLRRAGTEAATEIGSTAARAARRTAEGAATEGATEAGQEVIGTTASGQDPISEEAFRRYGQSALGGALLGGGLSGGVSLATERAPADTSEAEADLQIEQQEQVSILEARERARREREERTAREAAEREAALQPKERPQRQGMVGIGEVAEMPRNRANDRKPRLLADVANTPIEEPPTRKAQVRERLTARVEQARQRDAEEQARRERQTAATERLRGGVDLAARRKQDALDAASAAATPAQRMGVDDRLRATYLDRLDAQRREISKARAERDTGMPTTLEKLRIDQPFEGISEGRDPVDIRLSDNLSEGDAFESAVGAEPIGASEQPVVNSELEYEAKPQGRKRPLLTMLKQAQLQVDPDGKAGQELKALGLNSKNSIGLFKKGGRKELDNLPISDFQDMAISIGDSTVASGEAGGDYIDPERLYAGLQLELGGNPNPNAMDLLIAEARDKTDSQQNYTRAEYAVQEFPDSDTVILPPDQDARSVTDRKRDALTKIDRSPVKGLTPEERMNVANRLANFGGDVDAEIENQIIRSINNVEYEGLLEGQDAEQDIPFDAEDGAQVGVDADPFAEPDGERSVERVAEEGGRAFERDGGADGPAPQTSRTVNRDLFDTTEQKQAGERQTDLEDIIQERVDAESVQEAERQTALETIEDAASAESIATEVAPEVGAAKAKEIAQDIKSPKLGKGKDRYSFIEDENFRPKRLTKRQVEEKYGVQDQALTEIETDQGTYVAYKTGDVASGTEFARTWYTQDAEGYRDNTDSERLGGVNEAETLVGLKARLRGEQYSRSAGGRGPVITEQEVQVNKPAIEQALGNNLRQLGLEDVDLVLKNFIEPDAIEEGQVVAGRTSQVGGRTLINLATDIYDPNLTDAEFERRLAEVLSHEVVHALRRKGLMSQKQFDTILRVAKKRKYKPNRNYTYFDRERARNRLLPEDQRISDAAVEEEAVAELFKDVVFGNTKLAGPPRSVWDTIKNIFKALAGVGNDYAEMKAQGVIEGIEGGSFSESSVEPSAETPDIEPKDEQKQEMVNDTYSRSVPSTPMNITDSDLKQQELEVTYDGTRKFVARMLGGDVEGGFANKLTTQFWTKFIDKLNPVGQVLDELRANGGKLIDVFDTYRVEEIQQGQMGALIAENEEGIYADAVAQLRRVDMSEDKFNELKARSPYVRRRMEMQEQNQTRLNTILGREPSRRQIVGDAYLYAQHALERNAYLQQKDPTLTNGSGMSDAEAGDILQWLDANLDANGRDALAEFDRAVQAVIRDTNERYIEAGLVSQEEVDAGRGNFDHYVPLTGREADGEGVSNPRASISTDIRGRENKKMKGRSDFAADSPLASALVQNQASIIRAGHNAVNKSLADLIRVDGQVYSDLAQAVRNTPRLSEMKVVDQGDPIEFEDNGRMVQQDANDPRVVGFKEDGKQKYLVIPDRRIARALNYSNPFAGNQFFETMQGFNRFLANINTSYSPEFALTNPIRDVETAMFNASQYDVKGIVTKAFTRWGKTWPAMKQYYMGKGMGLNKETRKRADPGEAPNYTIPWEQASPEQKLARIHEFRIKGGQNNANQMENAQTQMGYLQDTLNEIGDLGKQGKNTRQKFVGAGRSLMGAVEAFNEVQENTTRVSVYNALRESGVSAESAAQAARNISTNFTKGGELRSPLNTMYLFYNASLQGSMAMLNAMARSGRTRKIAGSIIGMGFLMDQMLAMVSDEGEDGRKIYDKISQYDLEHNFFMPDLFGTTEQGYYKIPMGYGLNTFYNLGRASSRFLRGEYTPEQAWSSIFGTTLEMFNPLGDDRSFFSAAAPTVVDPFLDLAENKNYKGDPIYPEAFPGTVGGADSYQVWSTTSPTLKNIAQGLNSLTGGTPIEPGLIDPNPERMEYWIDFFTGSFGSTVQRGADLGLAGAQGLMTGKAPPIEADDIPVARRFYEQVGDREDFSNFVRKRDIVRMNKRELDNAMENRDAARIERARKKYEKSLRIYGAVMSIDRARSNIRTQKEGIQAREDLSRVRKQEIVEQLEERERQLIRRGNNIMKDIK